MEYHFINDMELGELKRQGKVIEQRSYQTVCGMWHYLTVNDGQFDDKNKDYAIVGTLEQYSLIRDYFGKERVIPIYIEVDGADRLIRSVLREKKQKEPKYAEICRRFLADEADFSEENIKRLGIEKRYYNSDLKNCVDDIVRDLEKILDCH